MPQLSLINARVLTAATLLIVLLSSMQIAVALSFAEYSSLQTWTEKSSLTTTLDVYAGTDVQGFDRNLHLRDGQHILAVWFNYDYARVEVAYNGGKWKVIFTGRGDKLHPFHITPPFSQGHNRLEIRWRAYGAESVTNYYSYHVWVVPAADRMFEDTEGNSMVLWQGGGSSLDKPMLIVEGFDPKNILDPSAENYPARYYNSAEEFVRQANDYGVDVAVLNFDDGGKSLIANADVVGNAVRFVSANKTGNTPVRLAGVSMGGVIARYALAKAEESSNELDVSHLLSLDAPQQGAVIDDAFQDYIKAEDEHDAPYPIKTMAAKQMLVYNTYDSDGGIHDEFYDVINNTNGDGYPELTRNIGVAFSTNSPNSKSGKWLEVRVEETATGVVLRRKNFNKESGDDISQAGSYLPKSSTIMRGFMYYGPLYVKWKLIRHIDPTFINYDSALDIVDGVSKFDAVIVPSTAHFHDEVPPEVTEPLLCQLDTHPPLAAEIEGHDTLVPGVTGEWTVSASGGTATYNYRWEYFLTCPPVGVDAERPCGEWTDGGTGPKFSYTPGSATYTPLKIRTSLTDALCHRVAQATADKTVNIRDASSPNVILSSSYPNPFNPTTVISFTVPWTMKISLSVYDVAGRMVQQLANRTFTKGTHEISFDASSLPSGLYFYTLITSNYRATHSILLVK